MKNTNETDNSMIQTYIHLAKLLSAKDVNNSCPILTNIKQALVQLEEKHSEEEYTQLKKEVIKLFRLEPAVLNLNESKNNIDIHKNYVDFAKGFLHYEKEKVNMCPVAKKLLPVLQSLDNSTSEQDRKESEQKIVDILRLKDVCEHNDANTSDLNLNIAGAEEALQNFC
jgi:hypothetical protein